MLGGSASVLFKNKFWDKVLLCGSYCSPAMILLPQFSLSSAGALCFPMITPVSAFLCPPFS
jgi:hypothetical protein